MKRENTEHTNFSNTGESDSEYRELQLTKAKTHEQK